MKPILQGQTVELVEGQIHENVDAVLQVRVSAEEGAALLLVGAFHRGGIFQTPVGRHWLAGPDRADFRRRVVADGEDEVHFGGTGLRELRPILAAQTGGV